MITKEDFTASKLPTENMQKLEKALLEYIEKAAEEPSLVRWDSVTETARVLIELWHKWL